MFTRKTIASAGIVAMLAAASLVGATAANADPIEHTPANQAALDALSAAGPMAGLPRARTRRTRRTSPRSPACCRRRRYG